MPQIVARFGLCMGEVLYTTTFGTLHIFTKISFKTDTSCRWVFHFAHLRQLSVLVPYIPTENPRLRNTAYEVNYLKSC